jgi:hypothetical protein
MRAVYINSAYRTPGDTSDDFTIQEHAGRYMNYPPKLVKLTYANIPYVWDNISSANDSVLLVESPNPGILVQVPIGNYDTTTLASQLQTSLNASGATGTYTVTYDSVTRHYTISSTVAFQLDFTIADSIGPRLGFTQTTTLALSATSNVSAALTDSEIFVCSDLVSGTDNGFTKFGGASSNDQTLAIVPVGSATFGSNIVYSTVGESFTTAQSNYSNQIRNNEPTNSMRFWLRSPSGAAVSLGDADWSCAITFIY